MTTAETHAPTYSAPAELGGVFWFSTVTAFVLAFSIGANDVANNFGTSVGSGAVSLRTAALVAGVAEVLGAVTLGSGVSDTIVRGISDTRRSAGAAAAGAAPGPRC
uniref:Uncharacterized protein n=1 Tax=Tetraselmis sp. GSL018 TaxID=582737 RepID=A0A061SFF5_9CHLO